MKTRRVIYWVSKFTLLDELLGMLYWGLAIAGIFFLVEFAVPRNLVLILLPTYLVFVVVIYLAAVKRARACFSGARSR